MSGAPPNPPASHTNRLASESSPYLLQHQHNPVNWYPWGDEAFERARKEDRPIFLSIGYSTCHWCHVMERESFENEEIAGLLNRDFVSIKVDREERPDIDNVYMTACQLMSGSGGWPLTAILTPDGRVFYTGTYIPPDDRYGRMGMLSLLPRLAHAWKTQRKELDEQADRVAAAVRENLESAPSRGNSDPLDAGFARELAAELNDRFDTRRGGFSGAPKFPPHGALQFLLFRARSGADVGAEKPFRKTLDEMQNGGIFDQVGGGFHRYSTDADWFIPHFEKMLYDNAQLLEIYSAAARLYGDSRYRETAERIVEWLEREMKTPEGAYACALDADSEGVEGKYYLWSASEIDGALGAESPLYREAFDIRDAGNTPPQFEEGHGRNLPRLAKPFSEMAKNRQLDESHLAQRLRADNEKLERVRAARMPPGRDDKVITAWNALAISALVHASVDLNEPRFLVIARRIADFLLSAHIRGDRLLHVSRDGTAKIEGFLDDYALFCRALLDLEQASGERMYEKRARALARVVLADYYDAKGGGFFQTASSGKRDLLNLSKEYLDQVLPSPNGVAVEILERLNSREPDVSFAEAASGTLRSAAPYARAFPAAAATLAILAAAQPEKPAALSLSAREGPVAVSAAVDPASVRPGESATIAVRIQIDAGWHVQSHLPTREELIATSVRINAEPDLSFGEPVYPPGIDADAAGERLSVYTGAAEIRIRVSPAPGARPGARSLRARVAFQPCDDSRCLAPAHVEIAIPMNIATR